MTARQAWWANVFAPWMFAASLLFLVCQAVLIVLWVDVPLLSESTGKLLPDPLPGGDAAGSRDSLSTTHPFAAALARAAVLGMGLVWPLVAIESVVHWIVRPKGWAMRWVHFYTLMFVICPSLRMVARSWEHGGQLWLPGHGWRRPDRRLRRRLERAFSVPMIAIACLILPVLIVEFFLKEQVARYSWLRVSLHVSTGVIWFAFAAEFIVMISIAEKKMAYVRAHWVDVVIIALPLLSFLRTLQLVRGTRIAKLAKVPVVTKLIRAYRLRGTAIKGFRALVLLDVLQRFAKRSPEKQLQRMRHELATVERERRMLRLSIARLERLQKEMAAVPSESESSVRSLTTRRNER